MLDHRMNTFLTLCKLLNYRETAQALYITQPAVTQHIQYLEREYGCELFVYKNRQLTKTNAAVMLEQYARSTRYNDNLLRQQLTGRETCEIRIGATKTIGDYVINHQVRQFLQDEKNQLTIIVDNTENLLRMLDENKLDFAFIEGYFDKQRYGWQLYRREPFVGICHRDHPFCGQEVMVPTLLTQTIIHREAGSGTREILERKLRGYNESLEQFHRHICISSFKLILEAVREGLGVSFVYKVLADSDDALGQFWIKGEPIEREFNIVYLKNTDPSEKINRFLES